MAQIPNCCDDCGFLVGDKCVHDFFNSTIEDKTVRHKECPLETEELDAKRFRVTYRGEKFYVVISLRNKMPYEVFAEHPVNMDHSLHYMLAGWDTCTRFITMALKKYPLEKVIRQLEKSSRQKDDLPDILSSILVRWV